MSRPIPVQRISIGMLANPTSIESALRRLPPPPPPPIVGLVGGGLVILGEVVCYGLLCAGALGICIANNRPIKCPDWGEFNDELARWMEYLALLAVCNARWTAAQLQRDLEIMVDPASRPAADAALLEAFLEFIACVAKADADYQASGGRPTTNRDRQF